MKIQIVEYSPITLKLTLWSDLMLYALKQLTQPKKGNPDCRVLTTQDLKTDFVEWSHALEQLTQPKNENPDCRVLSHDTKTDFVEYFHA